MNFLLTVLFCAIATTVTSEKAKCVDQYDHCQRWSKAGFCDVSGYKTYMNLMCSYSCNECSDDVTDLRRASGEEREDHSGSAFEEISSSSDTPEEVPSNNGARESTIQNNAVNPHEEHEAEESTDQNSTVNSHEAQGSTNQDSAVNSHEAQKSTHQNSAVHSHEAQEVTNQNSAVNPHDQETHQEQPQDGGELEVKANNVEEVAQESYEDRNPPGVHNIAMPKDLPDEINPRSEITKPVMKLNAMVQRLKNTIVQTSQANRKAIKDLYTTNQRTGKANPQIAATTANQDLVTEISKQESIGSANEYVGSGSGSGSANQYVDTESTNQGVTTATTNQESVGSANQDVGSGSANQVVGSGSGSASSTTVDEMKDIAGEVQTGSKIFEEDISEPESTPGCASGYGCYAGPGEQLQQEVQELESRSKIDFPESYKHAKVINQEPKQNIVNHGEDVDGVAKATDVSKPSVAKEITHNSVTSKKLDENNGKTTIDSTKSIEDKATENKIETPQEEEDENTGKTTIDSSKSNGDKATENKIETSQEEEEEKMKQSDKDDSKNAGENAAAKDEGKPKKLEDKGDQNDIASSKKSEEHANVNINNDVTQGSKSSVDHAGEQKISIDNQVDSSKKTDKKTANTENDTEQKPKMDIDATQDTKTNIDQESEQKKSIDQPSAQGEPQGSTLGPSTAQEKDKTTTESDNKGDNGEEKVNAADDNNSGGSSGENPVTAQAQHDETTTSEGDEESKEDLSSGSGKGSEPEIAPKEDSIDRISKEEEEEENIQDGLMKAEEKETKDMTTGKAVVLQGSTESSGSDEAPQATKLSDTVDDNKARSNLLTTEPKESDMSGSGELAEQKPIELEEDSIEDALFEKGAKEKEEQKQLSKYGTEVKTEQKQQAKDNLSTEKQTTQVKAKGKQLEKDNLSTEKQTTHVKAEGKPLPKDNLPTEKQTTHVKAEGKQLAKDNLSTEKQTTHVKAEGKPLPKDNLSTEKQTTHVKAEGKQLAKDNLSTEKQITEVKIEGKAKDLTSPMYKERINSIEKLLIKGKLKTRPYVDAQASAREELPKHDEEQSDETFLMNKIGNSHDVSIILDQHFYKPYNNEDSMAYEMLALALKKEVERAVGGQALVSQVKFSEVKKPGKLPSYSRVLAHFKLFGEEEKLHHSVNKGTIGDMMVDKHFYQSS